MALTISADSSAVTHDLQLDEPIAENPGANKALLRRLGFVLGRRSKAATDLFELRSGRRQRHFEQPLFIFRVRDTRDRADLGVREAARREGRIDPGQYAQRAGNANLLPRRTPIQTNPPGQPMGATHCALCKPTLDGVKPANARQQLLIHDVEARSHRRNLIAQLLMFGHGKLY